ncbi:MAG TPA: S8 family serine peptidase [Bryobacteraceae bacterium]|nr:S8 family serine peptidase [Bryobacteraceae bacterium]
MPEKKQHNRQRAPLPKRISGGGIVLALTHDEVYFETAGVLAEEELRELMRRHGLESQSHVTEPHPASFNANFPDRRWARIPAGESVETVIGRLEADDRIRLASPVYHRPDLQFKTALSFSDRLLARVRRGVDTRRMAESAYEAEESGVTVTAEIEQPNDVVLVRLTVADPKRENALECAERLSRLREVNEVHPDWLPLIPSITTTTPNDPLFSQEWDMTQIGAPQGWDLSHGSANVVIAIVDTGCDLNHEDLVSKYVPVANRRDVVAGTNTPNDDFGHGTCCASLAAAATSNGLGAAGVSWNCRVMPIKLLQFGFINSEADIVSAIDWARTNGANVVSMSWFWTGTTSSADAAFAAADAANMVLVAASGNFNGAIIWPALNPHIMAIGASDKIDKRKSPASPDGECWGSNFGSQQSVIAPGVLCWAANNTNGGASFNNNNGGPINWACVNYASSGTADGKYFALMNGTSAATPHVAGLAALLLSVNPGLTNTQVRNIIEQTADKTGGYAYVNDPLHPNGTWNQEPGYGRINVFHALGVLFPHVATAIVGGGNFGNTCPGSFVDELLTINNTGAFGTLKISNITSSSPDFLAPSVIAYPLVVNPGESIDVVIRFQPTGPGNKTATISVISNDPASPHKITVSGDARTPRLSLLIANTGSFGKACVGSFVDEPLILSNSGKCTLSITKISSSSPEFLAPQVLSYPVSIAAGNFLPAPIRFQPVSLGPKTATLTVDSDDPAGPRTITVSGDAPAGKLTITGSAIFGGVKCCHREQRTITLCNTGDCALHVSHVGLKHKRRHLRLINNPFPATIRPGSCLSLVIQYFANERVPKPSELIIKSDDPHDPVRTLEVVAYTIWDCCDECCKEPRKESCEEHRCGCCKERRRECCDDDDAEDEDDESVLQAADRVG